MNLKLKNHREGIRWILPILLLLLCFVPTAAQDKPQLKVDISITNRQDQEVLEPGYVGWKVNQGKTDTLTVDGIQCILSCPNDAEYDLRTGWSKSYIQNE